MTSQKWLRLQLSWTPRGRKVFNKPHKCTYCRRRPFHYQKLHFPFTYYFSAHPLSPLIPQSRLKLQSIMGNKYNTWIAPVSIRQLKKKIEREAAGNRESKSPYWKIMQKPHKERYAASYVKLLWYRQLHRAKKPSVLPKTIDLKSFWIFSDAEGFYSLHLQGFVKLKKKEKAYLTNTEVEIIVFWNEYRFWGCKTTHIFNRHAMKQQEPSIQLKKGIWLKRKETVSCLNTLTSLARLYKGLLPQWGAHSAQQGMLAIWIKKRNTIMQYALFLVIVPFLTNLIINPAVKTAGA